MNRLVNMEKNIKISIIMPSLNIRDYIEECIESVINQSLKEIEIICIDAGSDDGTLEILKNYADKDDRIKLLHSNKRSYGYQVNLGIAEANGEYIGIVETDDYIDEKMYEKLYNLAKSQVDIAKSNFFYFYDLNPPIFRKDNQKDNLITNEIFNAYDNPDILRGHPAIWTAIYRKSFLDENNIRFMEVPGGGWVDNPFLHKTALSAKSIIYTNEPLYYYRESNPNSSTNDIGDLTMPMKRSIDIFDVLDNYSCNEAILINVYIRIFGYMRQILNMNMGNQKSEVFDYFKKAVKRMDKGIVQKNMSLTNKLLYNNLSSNRDENSISTKLLVFFIRFIAKVVSFQNKRQYK